MIELIVRLDDPALAAQLLQFKIATEAAADAEQRALMKVYTVKEAAARMNLPDDKAVYRLIEQQRLHATTCGQTQGKRITEAAIRRFFKDLPND